LGVVSSRSGLVGCSTIYDPRFTIPPAVRGASSCTVVSMAKGCPPSLQCTVASASSRLFSSTHPCLSLADVRRSDRIVVSCSVTPWPRPLHARRRFRNFEHTSPVQASQYPLGSPFHRYDSIHHPTSLYQTHHSSDCKVTSLGRSRLI
jgi:hypothetical protein